MLATGGRSGRPTLYLIRHGETAWSLSGQYTGSTDIPLTVEGEAMALGLAPLLDPVPFARIFTSPRRRARQTCELATHGANAIIEPDLAERDYGDYEGMRLSEIWQVNPGWNVWQDSCPRGETLANVVARADRLLARLRSLTGAIALFSHGQFGCILAARWVGLAGGAGEHLELNPASLSILGWKADHPKVQVIARWNLVPADRLYHSELPDPPA